MRAKVIFHAKDKFLRIIEMDGISLIDIQNSLDLEKNRGMVFKSGEGVGASGSFFFFSADNKFLIKTL